MPYRCIPPLTLLYLYSLVGIIDPPSANMKLPPTVYYHLHLSPVQVPRTILPRGLSRCRTTVTSDTIKMGKCGMQTDLSQARPRRATIHM